MSRAKISALDGVRALAIIAVICYHLDLSAVPGGFLGVDVFFVLSGYLITWILISEVTTHGSVRYRKFYESRARRLIPAFAGVVLAVCIVASLFAPDTIPKFIDDLPWASTGTVNWWYVFNKTSYFEETARPPLLQHMWSLAVETQFYLLWPLVVAFFARRSWLTGMRWFATGAASVFAALSISLGLHIEQASALQASNFYFGTGSRCVGLLLGAAIAAGWTPNKLSVAIAPRARLFIDLIALASLASLAYLFMTVSEVTLHWFAWASPLAGLATAVAIGALVHPASRVAGLLTSKPLQWVGTRSYGLYLWHWPVFQLLRPGLDTTWPALTTNIARLAITVAVSEISYRFLEIPIRQRRNPFAPLLDSYRNPQARRLVAAAVTAIVLYPALALSRDAYASAKIEEQGFIAQLAATETTPSATTTAKKAARRSRIHALSLPVQPTLLRPAIALPTVLVTERPTPNEPGDSASQTATVAAPTPTTLPTSTTASTEPTATADATKALSTDLAFAKQHGVWVLGDSVLVGAMRTLREQIPVAQMDAKVGLQANILYHTLLDHRDAVTTRVVVLNIGNNGTVREKTLRKILTALADRTVVLIDAAVPRRWQDVNNALLRSVTPDFPNVNLMAWSEVSRGHPEYFSHDGIHLTAAGARKYVSEITATLRD